MHAVCPAIANIYIYIYERRALSYRKIFVDLEENINNWILTVDLEENIKNWILTAKLSSLLILFTYKLIYVALINKPNFLGRK